MSAGQVILSSIFTLYDLVTVEFKREAFSYIDYIKNSFKSYYLHKLSTLQNSISTDVKR